ncbi:unnamed protein product [Alopecurus aequalis]
MGKGEEMARAPARARPQLCFRFREKGHVCSEAGELPAPAPAPVASEYPAPARPADIISALPDDVLADDAVRTQTISPRWIHLWRSHAPLNLDDRDLQKWVSGDNLVRLVWEILAAPRQTYARRLSLNTLCRHSGDADRYHIFHILFQFPVLDRLEELSFSYVRVLGNSPLQAGELMPPLPPSALRFSSLRVATFGLCQFPQDLTGIYFPSLGDLTLSRITNDESTLQAMIAACPALQSLFIDRNYYFGRVQIISPTLVSVRLLVDPYNYMMDEIFIVDTPSLEKLIIQDQGDSPRNIRLWFAPKLEIFDCLRTDMVSTKQPGKTTFQAMVDRSLVSKSLRNVKIFYMIVEGLKLDHVIEVLKCFPYLQQLHIWSLMRHVPMKTNDNPPVDSSTVECIQNHLKQIEVTNYSGKKSDVNFAKFFVLNARVLESMKLCIPFSSHDKWRSNQRKKMNFLDRASPNARIHFESSD